MDSLPTELSRKLILLILTLNNKNYILIFKSILLILNVAYINIKYWYWNSFLKSSLRQNIEEGTEISHNLPVPHIHYLPDIQHPIWTIHLLQLMNLMITDTSLSTSPLLVLEFALGTVYPMDLKKMYNNMYPSLWYHKEYFQYPEKSSVLHLVISFSPQTPDNHWYFHCLHSCIFSRMLYSWNHIALSDWLLLFLVIYM